MNLDSVESFSVWVACDQGQGFTGGGSLLAYVYDSTIGAWARSDPSLDLDIFAGAAGKSIIRYAPIDVLSPRGQLAHIANGVGITGGGLTITYTCTSRHGERI